MSYAPSPSSPAIAADAVIYTGASTSLLLDRGKQGTLHIRVTRQIEPDGRTKTTVEYERGAPCKNEPVAGNGTNFVNCPILWTKTQNVAEQAFSIDPMLATGTLTHVLRGAAVSVTWSGFGDIRTQSHQNGNLLMQTRDARGVSKWGKWRYTEPAGAKPPSTMYRRVSEPPTG